ncbi:MAG: CidA/LrgA family protein [Neobacillus sp.]|jgi:holin-like protein
MKRIFVFIMQLVVLILIYHLGNYLAQILHLKIPGNVIGMLILLLLFWLKVIKVEQIEAAAGWLLKHLGFFFIPISVGLMTLGDTIKKDGFLLLIILLISAFIGLITSGKVTQSLIKKREEVNNHDHAI